MANEYKIDEKTFILTGTAELLNIHSDGNQVRNMAFSFLGGRYGIYVKQELFDSTIFSPLFHSRDCKTTIGYHTPASDVDHAFWIHRYEDDDPSAVPLDDDEVAPSSLAATASVTFTLERWFRERFDDAVDTHAPTDIEDVTGEFFWKYKSGSTLDVGLTLNGDSVSFSDDPDADSDLLDAFGSFNDVRATFGAGNADPSASELTGTAYATLSDFGFQVGALVGNYDEWGIRKQIYVSPTGPYDAAGSLPQDQSRTGYAVTSTPGPEFTDPDPAAYAQLISITLDRTNRFQIHGLLQEGDATVSPFTLTNGSGLTLPGPVRQNIHGSPGGTLVLPTPFDTSRNRTAPLWEYGDGYDSLSIDHAEETTVDTWEYRWAGTNLASGPTVTSGRVHLTGGSSGTCTLAKTLVSDLEDLLALDTAGRAAWWQTQKTAGLIPTDLDDWWMAVGDPANTGTGHVGEIHKICRRLRLAADADEFRLNARYLKVTGKSDAPCTCSLRIEWDDIVFRESGYFLPPAGHDQFNPYDIQVIRTSRDETWEFDLTDEDGDVLLDLSAKAGSFPLSSVKTYTLTIPNDRVVELEPLKLARKAAPKMYVHPMWPHLTFEMSALFADLDGMASLAIHDATTSNYNPGTRAFGPFTLGGWPVVRLHGPYDFSTRLTGGTPGYDFSTVGEIVTEIGLNLGWSATYIGGPGHSSPDIPFWWDYAQASDAPLTITAKRKFYGGITLPNGFFTDDTFDFKAYLGFFVETLVVKAATKLPIAARVDLIRGSTLEDFGTTSSDGNRRLYGKQGGEDYTAYASKGEAEETSEEGANVPLMAVWFAYLSGKPTASLDDLDYSMKPFSDVLLTETHDEGKRLHHSTDREATRSVVTELSDTDRISSPSRARLIDGTIVSFGVQGGKAKAWSSQGPRNVLTPLPVTIKDDVVIKGGVVRIGPDRSILRAFMVDEDGIVYRHDSTDRGATWNPVSLTGLPTGDPVRGDVRHMQYEWVRAHVKIGGGIDLYGSPDAAAWSLKSAISATGSSPVLATHASQAMIVAYTDGGSVVTRRGTPASGDFSWGSPVTVTSDAGFGGPAIQSVGGKTLLTVRDTADSVAHFVSADGGATWVSGGYG